MRVISLKRETELLCRNNKSFLGSPQLISSLKTPLRVIYHSLKSVTLENIYVWGLERNNLNKPRLTRYVWDSPWSIYTFYQIDHDCLIVFNLYCLRTFLQVLPYVMQLFFGLLFVPLHTCATALNRNCLAIWYSFFTDYQCYQVGW
mgnify:CR=1 FL=1